jgi:ferredoxin
MKVIVNYDVCASTGSCMRIAPEVFEVRSDGYLYLLNENPGPELETKMREAEEFCPTGAITIEE